MLRAWATSCLIAVAASLVVVAARVAPPASTVIFEENFTADNSVNGQTAPTQTQLANRGWRDGISSVGTGYKFMVDPTLGKNVMYAHWSTLSAGDSDPKGPDGGASGWKKYFAGSRDVTLYGLIKFHHVEGAPDGAHWIRFLNIPNFGDNSPANADGQMDLDVSSSAGEGQGNQLYDATTKAPISYQHGGFFLYGGGSLAYGTAGRDSQWKDDIWYEVAWYLKAQTSGTGPRGTGNGSMRVLLRPYGTTSWATVFDGANFVPSARTDLISTFMVGPYMSRWTTDIRHYFSRLAVWSGDAISDGTLANFLGSNTPSTTADTTAPVVTITSPANGASLIQGTSTPIMFSASDNSGVAPTVTFTANGAAISSPYSFPSTGTVTLVATAVDAAGNQAQSTVTVNVVATPAPTDTTPPVLTFTSPSGSTVTQGQWVILSASANEPVGPITFAVNGAPATSPVVFASAGTAVIDASATDLAGNTGKISKTVSVVAPTSTPVAIDATCGLQYKKPAGSSSGAWSVATLTPASNGGKSCQQQALVIVFPFPIK